MNKHPEYLLNQIIGSIYRRNHLLPDQILNDIIKIIK